MWDINFYFYNNLNSDYKQDRLSINFHGVLQFDSTMINKPSPNDKPVPDFKARNINVFDVEIISDK